MSLIPLRVLSLTDVARYAYNFDFTYDNIFLEEAVKPHYLYIFGERIGDKGVVYFTRTEEKPKGLLYKPPENSEGEEVKFVVLGAGQENKATSILRMELVEFQKPGKLKSPKLRSVRLGSAEDLIKLAINSGKGEGIRHLCSFRDGKETVLYGLDLVEGMHGEDTTLYYAKTAAQQPMSFARYDYKSGAVGFTDSVGDHAYLYLKIINLAEKPVFFKTSSQ